MSKIHVEASHIIEARAEDLYAIMSDYRVGHPAVLPIPYFTDLVVEKGGQGAGTVIRVYMKVYGWKYEYHQIVSEPEPGRLLVETDMHTGQYSKFTFEPLDGGKRTRVTITSETPRSAGITGFIEGLTQPPVARWIYQKELRNLADYARAKSGSLVVS